MAQVLGTVMFFLFVCFFYIKKVLNFLVRTTLGQNLYATNNEMTVKRRKKKMKRRVKGHFLLSAYESVRNITLTGDCFSSVDALYAL